MSGIFHLLVRMMAQSGDQVGRAYVVRAILEHMSNITYEGNISMQQMEVSEPFLYTSVTVYCTVLRCTMSVQCCPHERILPATCSNALLLLAMLM
jgi:hypothetical protein